MTNKQEFNKRHKLPPNKAHTKTSISKISGIPKSKLDKVYDRGIGASKTSIGSIRLKGSFKKDPNPKIPRSKRLSKEQWAMARVYSFVNKIEGPKKLNHDLDLV
jgi:hypothetical protein